MPPAPRRRPEPRRIPPRYAPRLKMKPRPATPLLTSLLNRHVRLDLPHGCFNAGLVEHRFRPGHYICVYRPDEVSFTACVLLPDLTIEPGSQRPLGMTNCADPRLLWLPNDKLLMVYSSHGGSPIQRECVRAAVIMEPIGQSFSVQDCFRISPPSEGREKNWMPFLYKDRIFLVASVRPHLIYELSEIGRFAQPYSESDWRTPWFNQEMKRGNTNIIQLDDGNYLGTFHTVQKPDERMHLYDNGFYVFSGRPPFQVIRCSDRTYLPAEAAVEPYFRKAGLIRVCFPVGMVREGQRVLISYGDNDSSVKIMETTLSEILATTVPVS